MQTAIKFWPYQEVPSADLNALQHHVREALDDVVADMLFDEGRYVGLAVTKKSALEIEVASGRLVKGGRVYRKDEITTHQLAQYLAPAGSTRRVLLIAVGQQEDAETETRKFLVDAATRATQPRPVSTRNIRSVSLGLVAGAAALSPVRPPIPAGAIVIAEMTVSSAGITNGPTMEATNLVLSLEEAVDAIGDLVESDRRTAAIIATIRTDIAALAREVKGKADEREFNSVRGAILSIREQIGIPDSTSWWGLDNFGDGDETDFAFAGANAEVDGGSMRPGSAEKASKLTALLNPQDPKLDRTAGGFILPASTLALRLSQIRYEADVPISQYPVSTLNSKKKTLARNYVYYGTAMNSEAFAAMVKKTPKLRLLNPVTNAYETIDLSDKDWKIVAKALGGASVAYTLMVSQAYWDVEEVDVATTGSRVAQTFLVSQSGWYRAFDIGFTEVAPNGSVTLQICGCLPDGSPDVSTLYASSTLPPSLILTWPQWARFDTDPVFLERGVRYCMVITTTGAHKVGTSNSNGASYGTMFVSSDGAYWAGDLVKDLLFRIWGCQFSSPRVAIDIEDVTLAGGIREISTVLTGHQPAGTDIEIHARIAGVWRPLSEKDETVLSGLPTQVPLRLVFVGTPDLMPGIDLSRSRITARRPLLSSVHVSTVRSIAGNTTNKVVVIETSRDFKPANNTWAVQLLTGAGYATVREPTTTRVEDTGGGGWRKVFIFDGLPGISAWRIKTTLGADAVGNVMSVTGRSDYAAV